MPRSRTPRPLDARSLEQAALDYIERWGGSTHHVRRVLARRIARAMHADPGLDPAPARAAVEEVLARLQRAGVLDDRRWAEDRARSLLRRGAPVRGIRDRLRGQGLSAPEAAAATAALDAPDPDLAAACALVRRRRLGPYRAPEERGARREKDLAVLGRAGFSWAVARKVLDLPDPEALEATRAWAAGDTEDPPSFLE